MRRLALIAAMLAATPAIAQQSYQVTPNGDGSYTATPDAPPSIWYNPLPDNRRVYPPHDGQLNWTYNKPAARLLRSRCSGADPAHWWELIIDTETDKAWIDYYTGNRSNAEWSYMGGPYAVGVGTSPSVDVTDLNGTFFVADPTSSINHFFAPHHTNYGGYVSLTCGLWKAEQPKPSVEAKK